MIPAMNSLFLQDFVDTKLVSKDYALDVDGKNIDGMVEDLEHLRQSIYFILNTERYEYLIYSWNYGVEFVDLIGQPHSYVIPEIERRVTEALTQDERVESVNDFEFEKSKKGLHVKFVVNSIFGSIDMEVDANV